MDRFFDSDCGLRHSNCCRCFLFPVSKDAFRNLSKVSLKLPTDIVPLSGLIRILLRGTDSYTDSCSLLGTSPVLFPREERLFSWYGDLPGLPYPVLATRLLLHDYANRVPLRRRSSLLLRTGVFRLDSRSRPILGCGIRRILVPLGLWRLGPRPLPLSEFFLRFFLLVIRISDVEPRVSQCPFFLLLISFFLWANPSSLFSPGDPGNFPAPHDKGEKF